MLRFMIDTHCHLDFCSDPEEAATSDLLAMVSVGTEPERNEQTLALAQRFENVWAAVGIHPNSAGLALEESVRKVVEEQARHPRVVAVGETGFDSHWQDETLATQRDAFDWHAKLAAELDLPLILHVRDRQGQDDASRAARQALVDVGYTRGVLHCCNGHPELLETAIKLGWMVSFAGNLTYPSAKRLQEAARNLPRERLLVETDSPYLAPVPERGRRNTPANVRHTTSFLANLRGDPPEALERKLDENAITFYRLPLKS